jgi:flavin-dependent dehydrogenase
MNMSRTYDVIVVGARCAGSPTAMLLARKGYRVLVVDKATFPSDTISTHMIHPPGIAALRKWGLLDQVVASGCPPIDTYSFDFGVFRIMGAPGTEDNPVGYGPRRTVLDKILVDGASRAGAEVREGFTVEDIVVDDGVVTGIRGHARNGSSVTETARVVVGADGRNSLVAQKMKPSSYNEKPQLLASYYSYWSGMPSTGTFQTYSRPRRGAAVLPTNDGLTLVIAGWPFEQFEANRNDIEGNYMKTLELMPELSERLRSARREGRFLGAAVPNYFRKPFGAGWALVGDAGYNKDYITAFGITDAFHQAELCADALDVSLSGARSFEDAMDEYQGTRDRQALPMYGLTCQLASLEEPPPELQRLLGAVHGNQKSMDSFARMNAGVTSPAEFFSPENVDRIFAAAAAKGNGH